MSSPRSAGWRARIWRGLAAVLLILAGSAPGARPRTDAPASLGELDSADEMILWLNDWVPAALERHGVPGASVAVVLDGRIAVLRGYGLADVAQDAPMDPAHTVFALGSLARPVTAVAALQLRDLGLVDLHADVQHYLHDIRLEPAFAEPISLANLLTETGGLAPSADAVYTQRPTASPTLRNLLTEWSAGPAPSRAEPPSEIYAPSDMGYALAGYLVESVTGQPYADYVEANVLWPLGMRSTSLLQPPPPDMAERLAIGYATAAGNRPQPAVYARLAPAVGLYSTAEDMATLMNALLAGGGYGAGRVLLEGSAHEMLSPQFAHHPQLPGVSFGFTSEDGRAMQRTSEVGGYSSGILLLPDAGAGLFIAYNADQPALREELFREFLSLLPPPSGALPPDAPPATALAAGRAEALVGVYRSVTWVRSAPARAAALVGAVPEVRVSLNEDGTLSLGGGRWAEAAPLLFRSLEPPDRYAWFERDAVGGVSHLFLGVDAYRPLAPREIAPPWSVILAGMGLLACAALGLAITYGARRGRDGAAPGWLAAVVALLLAALLAVAGTTWSLLALRAADLRFGLPASLGASRLVASVGAALALTLPVWAVCVWWRRYGACWQRALYSLATLLALGFSGWLYTWGLLLLAP